MNDDLSDRDPPASNYPHIRSYAMRRGHVTQGQRRAHNELLPRYGVAYRPAQIDFPSIFARHAPVVLEIGFGMGETTAALASAHPEIDFFGCEVFTAGVGALLMKVEQHRLTNVRIVQHDAVEVVRDMIAPDTLAGVHIFFADPWPKKRHHKRRLVAQPFIGMLARRIAPGGYLHCATDWEDYALQMLDVLDGEPELVNTTTGFAEPRNPLCARPTTKFHCRGNRLGHGAWDLVFRRRTPAGDLDSSRFGM
jgi:tRNA (guanine-N7-)-methyltransferase